MIVLRQEQVDAFRQQAVADFERRALAHVRNFFAAESRDESDETVMQRVRACQKRAANYDLTTQKQIMCFVDTTYLLGNDFDDGRSHPELRQLLDNKKMDATEKAGMVVGWAYAWRQAQRGESGPHGR